MARGNPDISKFAKGRPKGSRNVRKSFDELILTAVRRLFPNDGSVTQFIDLLAEDPKKGKVYKLELLKAAAKIERDKLDREGRQMRFPFTVPANDPVDVRVEFVRAVNGK